MRQTRLSDLKYPVLEMGLLLAETISGETSVSLALLLSLVGLLGGTGVAAIISRVTHGLAIKQMREDLRAQASSLKEHADRIKDLENWRVAREAAELAIKEHASTTRGTQPYDRGK